MWEIANKLKISKSSIEDNLHQLGYINCFDVWVSHGFPSWLNGKESCQCRRHGFDPWVGKIPGEGNGNPFQILAWEIAWIEEPGRLQSMGLQRVGHD